MRITTLVVLGLLGCAASPPAGPAPASPAPASPPAMDLPLANHKPAPPAGRGSEGDAVRAAVFRYLVEHNASGAQTRVPFVCLEVFEGRRARDPSPAIMAAMASIRRPRVVPGSACDATGQGVFLKADRAKGTGLVFRTEEVTIEGDKATVTGGYYEANLSASGNVYTVERQPDGSWLVTKDVMGWIS